MNKGKIISEHPFNPNRYNTVLLIWGAVVGLYGVIAMIPMFAFGGLRYTKELGLVIGVGIPLLIGLILWRWFSLRNPQHIQLYQDGLSYRDKQGENFWYWQNISVYTPNRYSEFLVLSAPTNKNAKAFPIFLVVNGARRLRLDNRYSEQAQMIDNILSLLSLQRNYKHQIQALEGLKVGKALFCQDRIQIDKQVHHWNEVTSISIADYQWLDIVLATGKRYRLSLVGTADSLALAYFLAKKTENTETANHDYISDANAFFGQSSSLVESKQFADHLYAQRNQLESIIILCIALIVLGGSVYVYLDGFNNLKDYNPFPNSIIPWMFAGLLAPALALWYGLVHSLRLFRAEAVAVSGDGLSYQNRFEGKFWAWNSIPNLKFMKSYTLRGQAQIALDIHITEKDKLRLVPQYKNYSLLVSKILKHHYQQHLEAYKNRLAEGDTIDFGLLTLDKLGIRYATNSYNWQDIESCEFSNQFGETMLYIKGFDDKFDITIRFFGLNNPHILHELIKSKLEQLPSSQDRV